jgi:putative transcriptional regulator
MSDPNFARTVVLVVEVNDGGALGVVLNRPSETAVAALFPDWAPAAAPPERVFLGGPVQPEIVVALAAGEDPGIGGVVGVLDGVVSVDLQADADLVLPAIGALRVFAGYAGWTTGQLEVEIAERDWVLADVVAGDVFGADPDGLWRAVLRRQPGDTRILAEFPVEPSSN